MFKFLELFNRQVQEKSDEAIGAIAFQAMVNQILYLEKLNEANHAKK